MFTVPSMSVLCILNCMFASLFKVIVIKLKRSLLLIIYNSEFVFHVFAFLRIALASITHILKAKFNTVFLSNWYYSLEIINMGMRGGHVTILAITSWFTEMVWSCLQINHILVLFKLHNRRIRAPQPQQTYNI